MCKCVKHNTNVLVEQCVLMPMFLGNDQGACALIRTNTVCYFVRSVLVKKIWLLSCFFFQEKAAFFFLMQLNDMNFHKKNQSDLFVGCVGVCVCGGGGGKSTRRAKLLKTIFFQYHTFHFLRALVL